MGVGARFLVLFAFLLILLVVPTLASALCWSCEAGSYESAEGPGGCDCDEDEKCYDAFTKSTVYYGGVNVCFLSCSSGSATDYCDSTYILKEAHLDCYCCDEVKWTTIDCRDHGSYYCSDGKCVYDECVDLNCDQYDDWYCDPGNVKEYRNYYCTGSSCAHSDSDRYDCDNDDTWVCGSGNVKKKKDYYCSGGDCTWEYNSEYDCDDDDTDWEYYCSGDCVKRKERECSCSGGSCSCSWNYETLACNGDSDYCSYKDNGYSGCGDGCDYEEFDCDWDSECSSSAPDCVDYNGGVCLAGLECGCCNVGDKWDTSGNKCVECTSDSQCNSDYCTDWSYSCTSSQVKKSRTCYDYYCSSGSCTYDTNPETVVVSENGDSDYCAKRADYCSTGCSYGQYDCDWDSECENLNCVDYDGGICLAGLECGCCNDDEMWDSGNNLCVECSSNSDCGSDGYVGDDYCSNGDVYREYRTYTCSSGSCSSSTSPILQEDCDSTWEECSGGACVDKTCEEVSSDYKSELNSVDCNLLHALDTDCYSNTVYTCDEVRPGALEFLYCWAKQETCTGGLCIDPPDPLQGAECYYCSDYPNTGSMCSTEGEDKCEGGSPWECNDQILSGLFLCWEQTDTCEADEYCEDAQCKPYCGNGVCEAFEDHDSCWDDCIPPLGHGEYCAWKYEHGQRCGHGEYDCDEFATYDECDTSIGLDCMGPMSPSLLDGCCYSDEDWAWAESQCCDVSVGEPYCSSTTNDVMEDYGYVDGQGYCQAGSRVEDNCASDEVCSNGECYDAIYYTTHFEIHYYVEGDDAPDLTDDNDFEDASDYSSPTAQQMAPDYVENIGEYLEYGWDKYTDSYFNFVIDRPVTDVYISDCFLGFMCDRLGWVNLFTKSIHLDNTLSNNDAKTTPVHEFFHIIQILYADPLEAMWTAATSNWLIEGAAVWVEDSLFDTINDYMYFAASILQNTDQTLTSDDGIYGAYKSVLYWKYFEKYGTQYDTNPDDDYDPDGADIMRELWDGIKMNSSFTNGIGEVDEVLKAHGSSWRESFRDWLIANYAKELDNDGVGLYDYEEDDVMSNVSAEDGIFFWISTSREWLDEHVNKWASDYFYLFCNSSYATAAEITFDGENNRDIVFIILYVKDLNGGDGPDNLIVEQASLGSSNYFSATRHVDEYARVVLLIGGMSDDADYDLSVNIWCGDNDGDGYNAETCGGNDCDNLNPNIYPGAPEICDGLDSNCDGLGDDIDSDGDGLLNCEDDCPTEGPGNLPPSELCRHWEVDANGCHAYTDKPAGYPCGTRNCDHLDTSCRNYFSVVNQCDGAGSCVQSACNSYLNYDTSHPCDTGIDYGCPDGTDIGSDVYSQATIIYCDGVGYCNGPEVGGGFWVLEDECNDINEYCRDDVSTCATTLEGDTNGDCSVNIFDLAAVGLCFGQPATGGCTNADINSDGVINIFDLATVGLNYGSNC